METKNGKKCPICGQFIFDWECLCERHWRQIKLYDAIRGTHYIEDFLAGKTPIIENDDSIAESIKWIKNRRKAMLKDLCTEFCRRCNTPEQSTVAGNDKCNICTWKKTMNSLLSEYNHSD